MLFIAPKLIVTRARQAALPLCLCLLASGRLGAVSQSAAGQAQRAVAQTQSTAEQEVSRLLRQGNGLSEAGRFAEAVPVVERALALGLRTLGPQHVYVADSLNNLAALYKEGGDYAKAEALNLRALSIYEKAVGAGHPYVATSLNNLAELYMVKGDYGKAEPLHLRALAIAEKALDPDHPDVATSLNNLAETYKWKGDYARAEPLYRRALSIYEKVLGPGHPNVAVLLNNLAEMYRERGDYIKAEPLHLRARTIREKALGAFHPLVAVSLNNLAVLYRAKGDYAKAERHHLRALDIRERVLGAGHPSVAVSLNNLAELYRTERDYARAEPLYQRALSIFEKVFGAEHPSVATSLNNLALIHTEKGDYARAEPLFVRALAIREKVLGAGHPDVASVLGNLASLHAEKGDLARAVRLQSRSEEVRERNLSLVLAGGSERQKLAFLDTLAGEASAVVSLHARSAPADPQALRLALTTVLRRKGRALDAMSDQFSSLRRRLDPQDRTLLDQLSDAQSRLSALVLGGPGTNPLVEHRAAVTRLEAEVERLQDAVSRRSAEFRAQTQPVTVEEVRDAIPAGAALVEFFSYRPFDAKAKTLAGPFGPARYVAYVLRREGDPAFADLSERAATDADLARLLAAMKCPQSGGDISACPPVAEVKRLARAADERVMRPVRKLLGDVRQVFVSPDGALNLVPFAALVDEHGKYLLESYSLTYLTSGRDLLRLRVGAESRQPPLVFADPLFGRDGAPDGPSPPAPARRSSDLVTVSFERLKGTAEEAEAVGAVLPGVRVLTQARATESALKQVSGPRVLHVATHGFFLADQPPEAAQGARGIKLGSAGGGQRVLGRAENPLLRSGLALAGANVGRSAGGEDGILTALEASALDLWGTELVVLSACETGVGEVRNGEGVYGLRRALVLAGSESQVMSLWQVADEATRDLMTAYYRRLLAGEGRTEALRRVQLEMLKGTGRVAGGRSRELSLKGSVAEAERGHPYFWAAFIQSGDWRPLGGQAAPAK